MKHGATARRLTPISFSRIAPSWTDGAVSMEAVMTGSASRAASSTEVTLAIAAASGPPTVAMRTPSAAVTMLNSRTRSARARPASASRMCSTSAIIALELTKPLTMALVPLAATASRSLRITGGLTVAISGITTAHGVGAVGPPRGRVGEDGAQVGRVVWAAAVDPGGAYLDRGVVHPDHRGKLADRAGGQVGVPAGDAEHEGRGALRQAGGHRAAVTAAARPRRAHRRLAHRERLGRGPARQVAPPRPAARRPRGGSPGRGRAGRRRRTASKLPAARALGRLLRQVGQVRRAS